MSVVPINPNAVEISIIQTGCLKAEFDSTYPAHLNGIISPDDFQQSVRNINQTISSRKPLIICAVLAILCLVGGMLLFLSGGLGIASRATSGFPALIAVGLGFFFLGMIVLTVGCCIIQSRRTVRMQRAIANESMKYSSRSPILCSWRLESSRIFTGGYGNRRAIIIHRIVIEIARPVAPGGANVSYQFNQASTQPVSFFPQQNDMYPPPPPYNSHMTRGFCSQCGAPQQNSTAKFCSSCGQPLNM